MSDEKHVVQLGDREITSPHVKCSDEEQGLRLSNDLCLVCSEPMNGEMNVEHASCKDKPYKVYQEPINGETTDNIIFNTPDDVTNDLPDDVTNDLPDDVTNDLPDDVTNDLPDDVTNDLPDDVTNDLPDDVTNNLPDDVTYTPDDITNDAPDDTTYSRPHDVQNHDDSKTDSHIYTGSTVSAEQATSLGMLIVDTRAKHEYDEGHIPGAVNLPLKDILADETPLAVSLEAIKAGISNNTKTALYDNSFGAVASRVAWTLELAGLERAWLLDVTYKGWIESGGKPSVESVESSTSAVFKPVENKDIYASIEDVESTNDDVVIVDNRERLNFLEQHIPNATNIPYHMLAEGERVLKKPKDLRRLFDNRGINEKTKIITYCGSAGTLSGLAFYALRHVGFENQRLYSKSLREWKASEKPIEKQPDAAYWDLSAE